MKVFVIVSSSRGEGNTYKVTQQLEEKIKELENKSRHILFSQIINILLLNQIIKEGVPSQ